MSSGKIAVKACTKYCPGKYLINANKTSVRPCPSDLLFPAYAGF